MAIESEIKKNSPTVFRRLYMKRRQNSGEYESDWQLIPTPLIQQWGSVESGIDDIKVNFYKYSGFNFVADNTCGYFSSEYDSLSFWYGYMGRYRTLVKVQAGYTADDGTEYPTNPTLFVGLLDDVMVYQENNLVNFNCNHLSKVFEEHPADQVAGMGVSLTASGILGKIKAHTQGSDALIFQKYISTGGWDISTTTILYDMATSSTLEGKSCWDIMKDLSEAENRLVYITRVGDLYFGAKTASSASPVFHFSGYGDPENQYGKNVIGGITQDENIKQVYNRIRIKHIDAASAEAYTLIDEAWAWGDSSSSNKYGMRTYEMQNDFMRTATAVDVANSLYSTYKWPKYQLKFKAKFVPHLSIYDWVTFTFKSTQRSGDSIWGTFYFDSGIWGKRGGHNINVNNDDFYIESIVHNVNDFTSDFVLREK